MVVGSAPAAVCRGHEVPLSRSPSLAIPLIALASAACGEWPRHAHLPAPVEAVPVGEDPATRVEVSWTERVPGANEPLPPGLALEPLDPGEGRILRGTLVGTGYNDLGVPETVEGEDCGSTGTRAPVDGDYLGDTHAFALDLPASAALCVGVGAGDEDLGLDLLLWRVDACGVPTSLVSSTDDEVLGLGGAGPTLSWRHRLDVDAERYSLMLGAYLPNDRDREVPYTLSIAVVPPESLCPADVPDAPDGEAP